MRGTALLVLIVACRTASESPRDASDTVDAPAVTDVAIDASVDVSPDATVGICPTPCAVNEPCAIDADCLSAACDAITHVCVSEPCADHHRDRLEADIDCGDG